MKRLFFLIILTWLIVLNVHGQDVNKSNYKAYAHCEEVQGPDGKIYNTFGEGYCPPGTKRDTRDYSQKKLDSINNAFDSVRDAMLAKHKEGLIKDYKDNFEFIRDTKMIFLAGGIGNLQKYRETFLLKTQSGEILSSVLGDQILEAKHGFYSDCVKPLFDFEDSKWGGKYQIQNGQVGCKLEASKKSVYKTTHFNVFFGWPGTYNYFYELKKKKKNNELLYTVCLKYPSLIGACAKKITPEKILIGDGFVYSPSASKSLAYKGGSSEYHWFTYHDGIEETNIQFSRDKGGTLKCNGFEFRVNKNDMNSIDYEFLDYNPTGNDSSISCGEKVEEGFGAQSDNSRKSVKTRLQNLKNLLIENLITQEEYETQRDLIIEQL